MALLGAVGRLPGFLVDGIVLVAALKLGLITGPSRDALSYNHFKAALLPNRSRPSPLRALRNQPLVDSELETRVTSRGPLESGPGLASERGGVWDSSRNESPERRWDARGYRPASLKRCPRSRTGSRESELSPRPMKSARGSPVGHTRYRSRSWCRFLQWQD